MSKSKRKPKKPRSDFPLFAHRNGQWAKTIRGKLHYFGPWSDPEATLTEYLRIRDDLQAGRMPTPAAGVVSLADMVNAFLEEADQRRAIGELSALSFRDYRLTGEQMIAHFGRTVDPERIRPSDFAAFRHKLAAKYAPSRLAKTVTVTRIMFRWAFETELIDTLPRFGPGFNATSKRAARAAKAKSRNNCHGSCHCLTGREGSWNGPWALLRPGEQCEGPKGRRSCPTEEVARRSEYRTVIPRTVLRPSAVARCSRPTKSGTSSVRPRAHSQQ